MFDATAPSLLLGRTVRLTLHAPDDAGRLYVMGASLATTAGIPVDTRVIPLNPDDLFLLSLRTPSVFQDFAGFLDAGGQARAAIHLPNESTLIGARFYTALFAIRPGASSDIGTISLPIELVIVP